MGLAESEQEGQQRRRALALGTFADGVPLVVALVLDAQVVFRVPDEHVVGELRLLGFSFQIVAEVPPKDAGR